MKRSPIIALVLFAALTTKAQAAPIYVDLGTAAPPGTLGGYVMTSFPDDPRPLFTDVTSVPSPLGGDLTFSTAVNLLEIGSGWATWSHGYTGDVYYSNGATSLGLGLPADTGAFYFYAEPNPFSTFIFTVTASDGTTTTVTQPIAGAFGARGFGFYSTSGAITSILVSSSVDFAIGEFGIARLEEVPEPAIVVLLGIGAAAVGIRRRRTLRRCR